jgi:outer membrane protein OmpA-like peptidoglycan-associated protein
MTYRKRLKGWVGAALSLAAFGTLAPSTARAQSFAERLVFNADLGLGEAQPDITVVTPTMAPIFQPSLSGIANVRLGVHLTEQFSVHAFGGAWALFGRNPMNPVSLHGNTGLGIRVGGNIGSLVHLFLSVDGGIAIRSNGIKPFWQGSGGIEFMITPRIGLGPFVRYSYESRVNDEHDRSGWHAGASFTFRTPWPQEEAPPAPRDQDGDGVVDDDDQCPTQPQGATPDPNRRGCPRGDEDRDGVWDDEDQCRTTPAGDHPDPNRRGCPEGDQDGDGVLDTQDQCPTQAQGEHPDPNRRGCPDADTDGDGVFDAQDQCREVPAGAHPDPNRAGCPIPDRDGDSVLDPVDHCPDQPGAPHPDPNRNGCPGLVSVTSTQIRITQQINFAVNSDRILPTSNALMQAIADALTASPQIRRVAVEGHTDDVGPDARNLGLSERRARAVVAWLTARGIDASRLEPHGYGETRPLQPITGLTGRALNDARARNRRVEFNIIDPAPARP